jgi:hypothetical protein
VKTIAGFLLRAGIVFAAGLPGLLLVPLLIAAWQGEWVEEIVEASCLLGLLMQGAIAGFLMLQASAFVARMYRVRGGQAVSFLVRALFFPYARILVGHVRDGDLTAAMPGSAARAPWSCKRAAWSCWSGAEPSSG